MISLIIPCYNDGHSIHRVLNAALEIPEIITQIVICDDCSTDNTPEVLIDWAKRFSHITVLRNDKNIGANATVSGLINYAKNEFVMSLASNDWFFAEKIKRQYEYAIEHQLDVVYGWNFISDRAGNMQPLGHPAWTHFSEGIIDNSAIFSAMLAYGSFVSHPSTIFRRSLFNQKFPYIDLSLQEVLNQQDGLGDVCIGDFDQILCISRRETKFGFLKHGAGVVLHHPETQISNPQTYVLSGRAAAEWALLILRHINETTAEWSLDVLPLIKKQLINHWTAYTQNTDNDHKFLKFYEGWVFSAFKLIEFHELRIQASKKLHS